MSQPMTKQLSACVTTFATFAVVPPIKSWVAYCTAGSQEEYGVDNSDVYKWPA